ncbi:MAG: hypothetical protein ACYTFG_00040 [Planctomycetota bacterium]|jgi:hypothetical protein
MVIPEQVIKGLDEDERGALCRHLIRAGYRGAAIKTPTWKAFIGALLDAPAAHCWEFMAVRFENQEGWDWSQKYYDGPHYTLYHPNRADKFHPTWMTPRGLIQQTLDWCRKERWREPPRARDIPTHLPNGRRPVLGQIRFQSSMFRVVSVEFTDQGVGCNLEWVEDHNL